MQSIEFVIDAFVAERLSAEEFTLLFTALFSAAENGSTSWLTDEDRVSYMRVSDVITSSQRSEHLLASVRSLARP